MTEEIIELEPQTNIAAPPMSAMPTSNDGLPPLEIVAKRAEKMKQIMILAYKTLSPKNVVNFGGEPYIDHLGSKQIANFFGLVCKQNSNERGVAYQKEMIDPDTNHYTIKITGQVYFAGHPEDAEIYEGSAESFGEFFRQWQIVEEQEIEGKKKKIVVSALTLPQTKVEEKATANLLQRAIKKKLGISPSWEMLEAAGIKKEDCKGFNFNSGTGADSAELIQKRQEVWNKILEICNQDVDKAKRTLKENTAFKDFQGHTDINKVKETQLNVLARNVDKFYKDYLKQIGAEE